MLSGLRSVPRTVVIKRGSVLSDLNDSVWLALWDCLHSVRTLLDKLFTILYEVLMIVK
jgi:hypothetical protein